MEIKINKGLYQSTNVEQLDDHKKVFLSVVSEVYKTVDKDHYIFFHCNDLEMMSGLRRFDPGTPHGQRTHQWFFECFDWQFHDYSNLGIKIRNPKGRHGWRTLGKPTEPVTITDPSAQRMWIYLMGIFQGGAPISEFELRDITYHGNAWQLYRDYIGYFNSKFLKKDYTLHDEGPMG